MNFDGSDLFFNQILLNSCFLSELAYFENPAEVLCNEKKFCNLKHSLGKICYSTTIKKLKYITRMEGIFLEFTNQKQTF